MTFKARTFINKSFPVWDLTVRFLFVSHNQSKFPHRDRIDPWSSWEYYRPVHEFSFLFVGPHNLVFISVCWWVFNFVPLIYHCQVITLHHLLLVDYRCLSHLSIRCCLLSIRCQSECELGIVVYPTEIESIRGYIDTCAVDKWASWIRVSWIHRLYG